MMDHDFDRQVAEQVAAIRAEQDLTQYAFDLEKKIIKLQEDIGDYQLRERLIIGFFEQIVGGINAQTFEYPAQEVIRDPAVLMSLLPVASRLMRKGADFDEILIAIESHETLKGLWEQLLATMKIIGEVEIGSQEANSDQD